MALTIPPTVLTEQSTARTEQSPALAEQSPALMEQPPLLRLAAELRNQIFELALTDTQPITISLSPDNKLTRHCNPNLLAFTRTCRQIHRDSRPICFIEFFSATACMASFSATQITFKLPDIDISSMSAPRTASELGRLSAVLRSLRVICSISARAGGSVRLVLNKDADYVQWIIDLKNPEESLRAWGSSVQCEVGKTKGGEESKAELRVAVTFLQGWADWLADMD
ncbi:hypothetical protein LTR85_005371 [Meristemomyces frigidus]|nr:hypothetical protein LTR85_005371 [Meristemomyces frigidus]